MGDFIRIRTLYRKIHSSRSLLTIFFPIQKKYHRFFSTNILQFKLAVSSRMTNYVFIYLLQINFLEGKRLQQYYGSAFTSLVLSTNTFIWCSLGKRESCKRNLQIKLRIYLSEFLAKGIHPKSMCSGFSRFFIAAQILNVDIILRVPASKCMFTLNKGSHKKNSFFRGPTTKRGGRG